MEPLPSVVLKNTVVLREARLRLLVGVVLGDGLGALRHGVLGQLTRQHQTDGRLDLAGRDGVALVVTRQAATLRGDTLEDVVDKRVHDDHGLLGDTGVGMDLLEHLVDVRGVRVGIGLLAALGRVVLLRRLASLAGSLSGCLCLREREKKTVSARTKRDTAAASTTPRDMRTFTMFTDLWLCRPRARARRKKTFSRASFPTLCGAKRHGERGGRAN